MNMTNTAVPLKIQGMASLFLVADLKTSVEFYTKVLGFEIAFTYDNFYCGISKDGYSIHLKSGSPASEERVSRKNNEDIDITVSIDEIEGVYEYIKSTSAAIIQPLRNMPYGREFYIADLDGYIIAFLQSA